MPLLNWWHQTAASESGHAVWITSLYRASHQLWVGHLSELSGSPLYGREKMIQYSSLCWGSTFSKEEKWQRRDKQDDTAVPLHDSFITVRSAWVKMFSFTIRLCVIPPNQHMTVVVQQRKQKAPHRQECFTSLLQTGFPLSLKNETLEESDHQNKPGFHQKRSSSRTCLDLGYFSPSRILTRTHHLPQESLDVLSSPWHNTQTINMPCFYRWD